MPQPSHRHHASPAFSLNGHAFLASMRQTVSSTQKLVAVLACLVMLVPDGVSAAPTPGSNPSLPPLNSYDGLTRENLSDLDAPPEPAPLAAASAASLQDSSEASRARSIARRHRRTRRHQLATQAPPPIVVVKASRRRNPAESFVYWWNGLVVRNFHTRFGTVLLDKIGAKT